MRLTNPCFIVFNQDYQIHDEAYPWKPASNLSISLKAPSWIRPAALLEVSPEEIRSNPFQSSNNRLTIPIDRLHVVRILVFVNDSSALQTLRQKFSEIIKSETRQF